jgi:hypothetical protein
MYLLSELSYIPSGEWKQDLNPTTFSNDAQFAEKEMP